MEPAEIIKGGKTYVELPHPVARTISIEAHVERYAEQEFGPEYYENIFLPFMEKQAPKKEIVNTATNAKLSLSNFSDCENSDLRVMYELLPPSGRYKSEHLDTPRIVCLNCDSLPYRVPSEMGAVRYGDEEVPAETVKKLHYHLPGGNRTILSRTAALLVLDKYTRPIPKQGIPDWISAGVLNAALGQNSESLYKWLEETEHVESKKVHTLQVAGKHTELVGYSITNTGKEYLRGDDNRKGHIAFLHKHSIRKPLVDCLEARINQIEETISGNLDMPLHEEVYIKSKMGESEKEKHTHNIYHIPDRTVRAIHKKQRTAFKNELGFPEPL